MARPATGGVEFTVKPQDTLRLSRALSKTNAKVTWDTMKVYLRKWAQLARKRMKKHAPRAKLEYNRYREEGLNTPRNGANTGKIVAVEPGGGLRKAITYRVKRYRRGRVIWVGIGGALASKSAYVPAGWRAHFAENGAYNKIHKRRLGRTRYRTITFSEVKEAGVDAIRDGTKAALRAGGFRS